MNEGAELFGSLHSEHVLTSVLISRRVAFTSVYLSTVGLMGDRYYVWSHLSKVRPSGFDK